MVKKITISLIILMMLFNAGYNCFALEIQSASLVQIGSAEQHLRYFREDRGYSTPVICSIVGYYNESGIFFPTYCMNKDLPGAETSPYSVNINSLINNDAVWRVVKNGWPYKTAGEMGLSSDFDAYAVTKFAVYCILGQSNLSYYSAIPGDSTGEKMLNVLHNLVNIGLNGTETRQTGTMSVQKVNGFLDAKGYYYQDYKISSSVNMSEFIVSFNDLPEGSYVADVTNSLKNNFRNGEIFRVLIPTDKLNSDINGKINITGKCETYPVFYGEALNGLQDYVVTYGTYGDEEINTDLNVSTNTGSLRVLKVDDETKIPIEGVSFTLKSEDGKYEYSGTTDSNGILEFNNLYQGRYILTETKTNENYILDEISENMITIKYNERTDVTIGNLAKKGRVKIVKTDYDTGETLEGVEFNILDSETKEIIETLVTNKNGEAISGDLRIDRDYVLQEVKALDDYILDSEFFYFRVEENEVFEIDFENLAKKGRVKIIKTDIDTGEYLEGVRFNIYEKNTNKLIQELVTDENGEAESTDLRIDKEYYLQEVETLEGYVLNEEKIYFTVEEDEIFEIEIGNLKEIEIEPEPEPEQEIEIDIEEQEILEEPKIVKIPTLPKTGF